MNEQRWFLHGEIDIRTISNVKAQLDHLVKSTGSAEVVLDCSGVRYIDSAGVGAVVRAQDELHNQGGRLRIENFDLFTGRLLDMLVLGNAFRLNRPLDLTTRPLPVSEHSTATVLAPLFASAGPETIDSAPRNADRFDA